MSNHRLRAQSFDRDRYEVIVVDDGSDDNTAAVAGNFWARVISIPPSGPAAARNRGVEETRGEVLLFTDADCAPDPGWIRSLVGALNDGDAAAAKGTYRTEQESWTARFVQAEYESRYRFMKGSKLIDFVDTYSAAYRRQPFLEAGGFDESFPSPSVEDQELSFRLASVDAKMVFCPGAVVVHRHAADPASYFRKKMKIGYWKMKVLGRHPRKAVKDSHTPSSLKMEVLLMAAAVSSVPVALFTTLHWLPFLVLGSFFVVTIPFLRTLLEKNVPLAMIAPFFLVLRSTALGLGMMGGLFGKPFRSRSIEKRMRKETEHRVPAEHHA